MKVWDISRTLTNNLAPWPGDRPFHFALNNRIGDGAVVNLGSISMSVHNGTHADAPFHFDDAGATIEQMALESYFGRAVVVDLSRQFSEGAGELIGRDHLESCEEAIAETSRLLIKTNVWTDSSVFPKQIPVLAEGVAEWLQATGLKLIGLDVPSVDKVDAKILRNHRALGRAGIVIVESLDLRAVEPGLYHFAALPLKITGGDGAPLRAMLWRE